MFVTSLTRRQRSGVSEGESREILCIEKGVDREQKGVAGREHMHIVEGLVLVARSTFYTGHILLIETSQCFLWILVFSMP